MRHVFTYVMILMIGWSWWIRYCKIRIVVKNESATLALHYIIYLKLIRVSIHTYPKDVDGNSQSIGLFYDLTDSKGLPTSPSF